MSFDFQKDTNNIIYPHFIEIFMLLSVIQIRRQIGAQKKMIGKWKGHIEKLFKLEFRPLK